MMMSSLKLFPNCILSVPFSSYEKDFEFIVNDIRYSTSKIIADILSPEICKLHQIDPTISTFQISTYSQGSFQFFLDLINFEEMQIPADQEKFICEIIAKLNNPYILIPNDTTKLSNEVALDNLLYFQNEPHYSEFLVREISFLAKHFHEIIDDKSQREKIMKLSVDSLALILSKPGLKLNSEDQLLTFINELYDQDQKYSPLYSFVNFPNVSQQSILRFLLNFDISNLDAEIWKALSNRLKLEVIIENEKSAVNNHTVELVNHFPCEPKTGGVIQYFFNLTNCQTLAEINITSSSVLNDDNDRYGPLNVVNSRQRRCFQSKNIEGSWLLFDFKTRKFIPSGYFIRASSSLFDSYPMSWVLEGSNNKIDWVTLDQHTQTTELDDTHQKGSFQISNQNRTAFKFIRICQTDINSSGDYCLAIDTIDFFGQLI